MKIDVLAEDRLELLETDDKRGVEARILVKRCRDVHRIPLARRFEKTVELPIQWHTDLMCHSEGEDREFGPLETLWVEQGAGTEQLDGVGPNRGDHAGKLTVSAVYAGGIGDQPLLGWRPVERVKEELEPARMRCNPSVEAAGVVGRELRHLQREERPLVPIEVLGTNTYNGQREVPAEERVELGDPARPRVQMVSSDTVDHQASGRGDLKSPRLPVAGGPRPPGSHRGADIVSHVPKQYSICM